VSEKAPDPAWRRLEPPLELTGNSTGTNFAIGAVNAFNLTAAATAPFFIFPRLGLGGPLAWIGLVWVPLVFSTSFFAIPLLRRWSVARENRKRKEGNLRKLLLSSVFKTSLVPDGAQPLTPADAAEDAANALALRSGSKAIDPRKVEAELLRLTADWDASVSSGSGGQAEYRFHDVRKEFLAAEQMRSTLALEQREVGQIVYSSGDSAIQESEREGAAFDRELARGAGDPARALARYAATDSRAAYVDDFELVAFDDELKRSVRTGPSGMRGEGLKPRR
jgi:hypothetical protein